MPFRPALIPGPVRPLVLVPIYLVRNFVKIIFSITLGLIVVVGLIISTAPLVTDFSWIGKGLATVLLVIIFTSLFFFAREKRHSLLSLLKRAEDVASGEIIAAAMLAGKLSIDTAKAASEQASNAVDTVMNIDLVNVTGNTSSAAQDVGKKAADAATDTASNSADIARSAVESSADSMGSSMSTVKDAATSAADTADETMGLLRDPKKAFGAIKKAAKDTPSAIVDTSVAVGGTYAYTGKMVVDVIEDTTEKAVHVVGTAVNETATLTTDRLQKLMELDPIFIFKRVVRVVLRNSMIVVIGFPIGLLLIGSIFWGFGIRPNGILLVGLALLSAVFGMPAFLWVRNRALRKLDNASAEVTRRNSGMV